MEERGESLRISLCARSTKLTGQQTLSIEIEFRESLNSSYPNTIMESQIS